MESRKKILYGSHDSNINNKLKNKAWEGISDEMSGLGFIKRGPNQLKKKKTLVQ